MSTRTSAPRCASCGMPLGPGAESCAVCGARVPLIARPAAVQDDATADEPAGVSGLAAGPAAAPVPPVGARRDLPAPVAPAAAPSPPTPTPASGSPAPTPASGSPAPTPAFDASAAGRAVREAARPPRTTSSGRSAAPAPAEGARVAGYAIDVLAAAVLGVVGYLVAGLVDVPAAVVVGVLVLLFVAAQVVALRRSGATLGVVLVRRRTGDGRQGAARGVSRTPVRAPGAPTPPPGPQPGPAGGGSAPPSAPVPVLDVVLPPPPSAQPAAVAPPVPDLLPQAPTGAEPLVPVGTPTADLLPGPPEATRRTRGAARAAGAGAAPVEVPASAGEDLDDLEHTRVRDPESLRRRSGTLALHFDTGERVRVVGRGLVGRGPRAEDGQDILHVVVLSDAARSLSRVHVEFGPQGATTDEEAAIWVMDRGSTNGTVVVDPSGAGRVLPAGARAVVGAGWVVRLGDREARVEDD